MGLQEALTKYQEAETLLDACDVKDWDEQISDKITSVLNSSVAALDKKVEQYDDEVTRLSDFIMRCWNSPAELATIKLVRPHQNSACVAICHCSCGSIVVKERGRHAQSSLREETYNRLAWYLSMPQTTVMARSFKIDLRNIEENQKGTMKVKDMVAKAFREESIELDGTCCPYLYATVEQFVDAGTHPLITKFSGDSGFVDIDMAFKTCPTGKPFADDLLIKSSTAVTDYDFANLIEAVDNDGLGELVLMSIIALQRDGTAVNVVIRSSESGSIDLIAIDNTRTFSESKPDNLLISFEEDDSRYGSYWYPCCLGLPGALSPLNPDLLALVQTWNVDELEAFVTRFLKDPHDARCCRQRVEKLQEVLKANPEISMKELAWAVVPSWKEDWDEVVEEYELGPLPRMQELKSNDQPLSVWADEEKASRCRRQSMKICGFATAAALLSYCAPRIILKYACPSEA